MIADQFVARDPTISSIGHPRVGLQRFAGASSLRSAWFLVGSIPEAHAQIVLPARLL